MRTLAIPLWWGESPREPCPQLGPASCWLGPASRWLGPGADHRLVSIIDRHAGDWIRPDAQLRKETHAIAVPSLGGEGQDEGGRYH
jgi:hypothetical protein